MARPNRGRTIREESNLAERVQYEREQRGWTYEAMAKALTDAGCRINASAIFKIEKGDPPRRITVDELVAFSRAFSTSVEDLLTPMEVLRQDHAKLLMATMDEAAHEIQASAVKMLDAMIEHNRLAASDPDLYEYVHLQMFGEGPGKATIDSSDPAHSPAMQGLLGLYEGLIEQAEGVVRMEEEK